MPHLRQVLTTSEAGPRHICCRSSPHLGMEPTNCGTEPDNCGTEPANCGTEPINCGTEPINCGTEPPTVVHLNSCESMVSVDVISLATNVPMTLVVDVARQQSIQDDCLKWTTGTLGAKYMCNLLSACLSSTYSSCTLLLFFHHNFAGLLVHEHQPE